MHRFDPIAFFDSQYSKLSSISLAILSIAKKELKHIERLGGILGGLIGLIQGIIVIMIR